MARRALANADEVARASGGAIRLLATQRAAYLDALHTAMDAAMQEDRGDEVIRLSTIGLRIARELPDEPRVGSLLRIGFALLPFGRLAEAETSLREAWDMARRLVMPVAMVEAGNGLARLLPMLGRYEEARSVAVEADGLEQRLGSAPRRWGNPRPWLHVIELSTGDPAAALRALRDDAEVEADPHFRLRIRQNIATWQARFGGPPLVDEVRAELDAARKDAELAACPRCLSELLVTSGELLARVGRVEDAGQALAAWRDRRTGRGYPLGELRRARSEAAIAIAEGPTHEAVGLLVAAQRAFEDQGLLEDALWVRLDLGRVLVDVDRAAAVRAFTAAASLAQQLGAASQERLATRRLRELGVRTWRRGRRDAAPGITGLSSRESEVARLAAEGTSNREIAVLLGISPRTVERHVTNVFAKLGLRNRTELSKIVLAAGPVRGSTDDRGPARS
jgi:DNA-binding CsgD family transcriptional regulator